MKQNKKMIVCFLTPALIFFVAAFLYPICRTVVMSLFKVESISDPVGLWEFVGLSNFTALAETTIFQVAMINMLKIWLIGGVLVLSVALLFAGILTSGIVGKNVYRAIIYVPNIINAVAMSTMWINYVYNKRFGLFAQFLYMDWGRWSGKAGLYERFFKVRFFADCFLLWLCWLFYADFYERH